MLARGAQDHLGAGALAQFIGAVIQVARRPKAAFAFLGRGQASDQFGDFRIG